MPPGSRSSKRTTPAFFRFAAGCVVAWLCMVGTARAIILYDTADALANTTAPTGIYADSGWEFIGEYKGSLGTMIGSQYFITAQHIGAPAGNFTSRAAFNGNADVSYTIDAAANGGTGYWDIGGTDLRIYKITGTFASYVPLYTGSSEVGLTMLAFGRGGPRGSEVYLDPLTPTPGTEQGWYHTGSDGVTRWGANVITGTQTYAGLGSLLIANFDAIAGQNEATFSPGDSGGPVFVFADGQWQLVGISYGVEGSFDRNNITGDGSEFDAAMFDKSNFYQGSDANGWVLNPDLPGDSPSSLYASRISTNLTDINGIVGVPEPTGAFLLTLSMVVLTLQRRRQNDRES